MPATLDDVVEAGNALLAEVRGIIPQAQALADIYPTIAAGRGAVANGEFFRVATGGSDGLTRLSLYRRDSSGTQTLLGTQASGSEVDSIDGRLDAVEDELPNKASTSSVTALQDRMGTAEENIDVLEARADGVDTALSELTTVVGQKASEASVTTLQDRMGTAEENIDVLEARADSAAASLDSLVGDVTDLLGPNFPGAAEIYESLQTAPVFPVLEVQAADGTPVGGIRGSEIYPEPRETLESAPVQAVLDAAGRVILRGATGSECVPEVFESISRQIGPGAVLDRANRVLAPGALAQAASAETDAIAAEVQAARGSQASVTARLDMSLSQYGLPLRHIYGEWYLRETRQRLRKRLLGESARFVVAAIGDSWTHNRLRWSGPVASTLKAAYGDGGPGWLGFASNAGTFPNGNVDSGISVTYGSGWVYTGYYTSYGPDIGKVISAASGNLLTINGGPASCSAVKLFAEAGSGSVRYRWNGGSWTTQSLAGSGLLTPTLSGLPSGTWTLEIEALAADVALCGLDIQKSTDGVVFHKLGATGSRLLQWQAVDATQWQAALAAVAPNLVTIMHGTNDQGSYGPAAYRTYLDTLIDRVRAAAPLADVLLIAPCENGRVNANPMAGYAEQKYQAAAAKRCAFLNLQHVFGENFSEYASTSARAWFNADLIHPEPLTGGRAIADAVLRLLTQL